MSTDDRPAHSRPRDGNPFHRLLDIEVEESSSGYTRIKLPFAERLLGGVGGSPRGGELSALVGIAALGAMTSVFIEREQPAGTAVLSISYLRPALGGHVIGEARVLTKDNLRFLPTVALMAPISGLVASR